MLGVNSQLGTYGDCIIDSSYQNNIFTIGYGHTPDGLPANHVNIMSHILTLSFINGQWHIEGHEPDPSIPNRRRMFDVSEHLKKTAIETVLGSPVMLAKLKKWRKDTIKRLEKSVPRLKSEYEDAIERLAILNSISF